MDRLKFLKTLTEDKLLHELLATIHGDGGHHTLDVGVAQSVRDAELTADGMVVDVSRESILTLIDELV